jgi:translation initiation factor 3 subunit C
MDVEIKILYNRAITQLGITAFNQGLVHESHNHLQDIYSTKRIKELLAQGVYGVLNIENSYDQELFENRILYPIHMHINLELVESIHLISCLFVEATNLIRGGTQAANTRQFQKLLDFYSRASLTGILDSTRDKIVEITRLILKGHWLHSLSIMRSLPCWSLLSPTKRTTLFEYLEEHTRNVALQVYLIVYSSVYSSLSLLKICKRFNLDKESASSIICTLIKCLDISGTFDQRADLIIFETHSKSKLQKSIELAYDKADILVEINENTLALDLENDESKEN